MSKDASGPTTRLVRDSSGRYRDVEPLGEGGMAEVFKAYDARLERPVALKFLRIQHPDLTARLLREAQIQARLEHPNICRVYEVGEMAGRPFIAMQLIQGKTLDRAALDMSLEERVLAAIQVADAIHAAHRLGLIHRDLKPVNIMVEQTDEGRFVPYVTDFGLARDVAAPSLSVTGSVTGTPDYMAPEQVRGDASSLDRRTDVYALGATLYQLLSGSPPFPADSAVDVMVKVLAEEPRTLRAMVPSIPRDLDTIVSKCLEKEPQRRYDSAKALADDLRRYVEGEPISAAPPSLTYRLLRKAGKNRLLTAVSAVSAVAILVLAGLWIATRLQASERARLAQRFGSEMERAESLMRIAHLLPLHDTRTERNLVEVRIREIEREMARLGRIAQGPGNAAMGRAYLALGRHREARERLERARTCGSRGPETAYALGQTLGALYQEGLEQARRLPSKDLRDARREELGRSLRDPALAYLEGSLGSGLDSPSYARGLIALYEGRYDEAASRAREAFAQSPWLFEARRLEGDAYAQRAAERQDRGDFEGALADLGLAAAAYEGASASGRSDPATFRGEAVLRLHRMEIASARGLPADQDFAAVAGACDKALAADPDSPASLNLISRAWWHWGQTLADKNQDPSEAYRKGIGYAEQANRVDPRDAQAFFSMSYCYFRLGEYEGRSGKDPRPTWERAVECSRKGLALAPGESYALNIIGLSLWRRGDYEGGIGVDPRPSLDQAAEAFRSASQVQALYVYPVNLGNVYLTKGIYEIERGVDPTASLDLAIASYRRAIGMNSKVAQAYSNLASAYFKKGEHVLSQGGDPRADLKQSVDACLEAIALNPTRAPAYYNMSTPWMVQGIYTMRSEGKDPAACLDKAREAVAKAVDLRPGYFDYVRRRGEIELYDAQWAARVKSAPDAAFGRAVALLNEALKLNGKSLEAYRNLGETYQAWAQWRKDSGAPPGAEIQAGLAATDRALGLNPSDADLLAMRGAFLLESAKVQTLASKRRAGAARAVEAFRAATAANPKLDKELAPRLREAQALGQ